MTPPECIILNLSIPIPNAFSARAEQNNVVYKDEPNRHPALALWLPSPTTKNAQGPLHTSLPFHHGHHRIGRRYQARSHHMASAQHRASSDGFPCRATRSGGLRRARITPHPTSRHPRFSRYTRELSPRPHQPHATHRPRPCGTILPPSRRMGHHGQTIPTLSRQAVEAGVVTAVAAEEAAGVAADPGVAPGTSPTTSLASVTSSRSSMT